MEERRPTAPKRVKPAVARRKDPQNLPAIPNAAPTAIADARAAIASGMEALKVHGPKALELAAKYMDDPESVHHEWACKFWLERVIPARAIAAAGIDQLGGRDGGTSQAVTIKILPATGPKPVDAAITVVPREIPDEDPAGE